MRWLRLNPDVPFHIIVSVFMGYSLLIGHWDWALITFVTYGVGGLSMGLWIEREQ